MESRNMIGTFMQEKRGLCVVISSFICSFVLWGFGYTFTLLFIYLQEDFQSSTTATGWVGSVYFGLGSTLAVVISPLVKRFKYRTVFQFGILLASLSLLASSFVHSILVLFVTYGVFYATGTCIAYYSSLDLVKLHYANTPYRTRTTYFSTLGATVGFLVQSPIVGSLLTLVGWRVLLRIYAGLTLFIGLGCSLCMQKPHSITSSQLHDTEDNVDPDLETKKVFLKDTDNEKKTEKYELDLVQENNSFFKLFTFPESWYFLLGMIITSTAAMFSYINMVDYMNYLGISMYVSSWILVAAAGSEVGGKIFFALYGDRMHFPKMYIMAPNNVCLAGAMVVLMYTRTSTHLILLVIVLGFLKNIFHAMPWTATIELFGIKHNTQSTIFTCLGFGFGSFSGTLVGGLSYDYTGSYDTGLLVCCALYLVGAILFQAAPLHQKYFAPHRYLVDNKQVTPVTSASEYQYVIDTYISTV